MGKPITPEMAPILPGRLVRIAPNGRRGGTMYTAPVLRVERKGCIVKTSNIGEHLVEWWQLTDDVGHNKEALSEALKRIVPPAPPTAKAAPMTQALTNAGSTIPRPTIVPVPDAAEAQRLRDHQAINGLSKVLSDTVGQTAGDLGLQIVRQAENVEAAKQLLTQAQADAKRMVDDATASLNREVAILRSLRADAQDLVNRADKLLAPHK